jgi:hypothetical protein
MLAHEQITGRYPIHYRVKQGETLFGIAKRMLQIPVEKLMEQNALTESDVRPGQVLLAGWLRKNPDKNIPEASDSPEEVTETGYHPSGNPVSVRLMSQKGVAWWNKARPDPNLFVLHRIAPVNSMIEINNPMFGRKVMAKVIGTVPPTYPEDLMIIVSQGIAKALGALDSRFYVEVKYVAGDAR